mmetsp:Transcript_31399/g.77667  ORF Transcript_31399/g.77667 Transcript_31399/m.77667 type:complete len:205 (-) Transcript_31399:249-863(-)
MLTPAPKNSDRCPDKQSPDNLFTSRLAPRRMLPRQWCTARCPEGTFARMHEAPRVLPELSRPGVPRPPVIIRQKPAPRRKWEPRSAAVLSRIDLALRALRPWRVRGIGAALRVARPSSSSRPRGWRARPSEWARGARTCGSAPPRAYACPARPSRGRPRRVQLCPSREGGKGGHWGKHSIPDRPPSLGSQVATMRHTRGGGCRC